MSDMNQDRRAAGMIPAIVVGVILAVVVMGCILLAAVVIPALGMEQEQQYFPIIWKSGPTPRPTPTLAPTMDPYPPGPTYPPPGTPGYCLSIGPAPTPTPTGPHCFIGTPPRPAP